MKPGERVDAGPFLAWFDRRVAEVKADGIDGAQQVVLIELGWPTGDSSSRKIYRWRHEGVRPLRDEIFDALDQAGVDPVSIDPALAIVELWRFCPSCEIDVLADSEFTCPLCEGGTTRSTVCPSCGGRKTRAAQVCIACVPRDDNGYHMSVAPLTDECPSCGGPKNRFAQTCWRCFVTSGGQRGTRHRKTALQCISPETLLRARELYDGGMSIRAVASEILPDTDYANARSAASSLFGLFDARGWPRRDRGEATAASNRERTFRPQCSHVFAAGSKKGQRCARGSHGETGYCWHHRPDRIAAGVARVRAY